MLEKCKTNKHRKETYISNRDLSKHNRENLKTRLYEQPSTKCILNRHKRDLMKALKQTIESAFDEIYPIITIKVEIKK